jgi:hypothetical protein
MIFFWFLVKITELPREHEPARLTASCISSISRHDRQDLKHLAYLDTDANL